MVEDPFSNGCCYTFTDKEFLKLLIVVGISQVTLCIAVLFHKNSRLCSKHLSFHDLISIDSFLGLFYSQVVQYNICLRFHNQFISVMWNHKVFLPLIWRFYYNWFSALNSASIVRNTFAPCCTNSFFFPNSVFVCLRDSSLKIFFFLANT